MHLAFQLCFKGLLPMRDTSVGNYDFEEKYLGPCENYNEQHMKIRKSRWIAFRKANSRLNYEPEMETTNVSEKESKVFEDLTATFSVGDNRAEKSEKKKKGLPSFFFTTTVKSDSEDDIFTAFHEGFYNEHVKKRSLATMGTSGNKKI